MLWKFYLVMIEKKTNKIRLTYTQTVKSRGKKNTIGIYNKIYVKQNF